MAENQTFDCPSCGAPLTFEPKPGEETVECAYCHETVVIPKNLRIPLPKPVRPVVVVKKVTPWWVWVVVPVAFLICLLVGVAALTDNNSSGTAVVEDTPTAVTADTQATMTALQPFLKLVQGWPVSFSDPFQDNTHNWSTGDIRDEYLTGNRSISNGVYTWQVTANKSTSDSSFPDMTVQQDFLVGVDMKLVNMPDDPDADAGLFLRHSSGDPSWYYFSVNDKGQYYFGWYNGTDWSSLIPETTSPAIQVGETNRLEVGVQGSQFIFIINHVMVDHFVDEHLKSGDIGLGVNLPGTNEKATVEFSNFSIQSAKP